LPEFIEVPGTAMTCGRPGSSVTALTRCGAKSGRLTTAQSLASSPIGSMEVAWDNIGVLLDYLGG
jgi:hypothetical protein